ncbi:MAG: sugar phosphate nucleotidyltransferase [Pseudomonadota bacterium]|jgi:MurNAc alpha-1-phosphate uridylyltransferase|nr:sugar phosphate nucleotidyltransferase [Pseudomonadota bacterium]MEC7513154.1 sugar phosphate nucleotidyltransferase [Pseudomonadota bacterium]GIR08559.1 MAG: mannose-1-phosphate guanylyltransferase [Gammaproteobacteria bacterium]|tara:strand:- start:767 stop:1405 length:639 start_codon:yes stop_codon:yes gene_type:complete
MKAMILAAGFGKRLGHLTQSTPKPLIKVKGQPLIKYHLSKLLAADYSQIVINTHYLSDEIINYVENEFNNDPRITFSIEKEILGTGGGIKKALHHFGNDDFLVLNSDIYSDLDYKYFKSFTSPTLFAVETKNQGDFNIKNSKVCLETTKNYTWMGFSVVNAEVFNHVAHLKFHYWDDCLKRHASSNNLYAEIPKINWYDVGTIQTLELLNNG